MVDSLRLQSSGLATSTMDRSSRRIQSDSEPASLGHLPGLMNKSQVEVEDTETREVLKIGDLILIKT